MALVLTPGAVPLATWRRIYREGAEGLALAESARGPIAASAAAVARILARGEPVYGINTGFGKLASVRIETADLASAAAQHRAVAMPPASASRCRVPVARLMMALKLASLAQGASGVQPATVALLEAMLARDLMPVVPGAGLGRRFGRSRAARPYGGGDDRRRRDLVAGERACRPRQALAAAGLAPLDARAEGGAGAAQRHAVLHRLCAGRRCSRPSCCSRPALVTGRALDRCGARARTRRSIRASMRCAAIAGRSRRRMRCARLMAGSAIRASHLTGDERVQDPYCLRCQPQVMGAALDRAAAGGGDARHRGERRFRQSADLRRRPARRCRAAISMPSLWLSRPI